MGKSRRKYTIKLLGFEAYQGREDNCFYFIVLSKNINDVYIKVTEDDEKIASFECTCAHGTWEIMKEKKQTTKCRHVKKCLVWLKSFGYDFNDT